MLSKKIVKYIQSLSHKKFRDEEGTFVAEGPKIVSEFLISGQLSCRMICAEKDWLQEHISLLKDRGPEQVYEADASWLQRISQLKTAHKVVAVFDKKPQPPVPDVFRKVSLMLDDLKDPGNLGTIIRIADWFALPHIICSRDCVDCYNPKVVQATMGSLSRVNVFYEDLIPFIQANPGVSLWAATLSGIPVGDMPAMQEGIILIGNEARGVGDSLLELASHQVTIPRYGQAESLNAAVATGIILSHLLR